MKRHYKCGKCGQPVIIEGEPTAMCTLSFPFRTSGICGGAFEQISKEEFTEVVFTEDVSRWLMREFNIPAHGLMNIPRQLMFTLEDAIQIITIYHNKYLERKKWLLKRSEKLELLERYSLYLEKQGYTDIDWRTEEPFAIDEFMKQI